MIWFESLHEYGELYFFGFEAHKLIYHGRSHIINLFAESQKFESTLIWIMINSRILQHSFKIIIHFSSEF